MVTVVFLSRCLQVNPNYSAKIIQYNIILTQMRAKIILQWHRGHGKKDGKTTSKGFLKQPTKATTKFYGNITANFTKTSFFHNSHHANSPEWPQHKLEETIAQYFFNGPVVPRQIIFY